MSERVKLTTTIDSEVLDTLNKLAPYYTPKGKKIGVNYVIEAWTRSFNKTGMEVVKDEVEKINRESEKSSTNII